MCRDNSYFARQKDHDHRWSIEHRYVHEWVEEDRSLEFEPTYHKIAGVSDWPVIIIKDGKRETLIAHWGLIPFWTKDKVSGMKMSNSMVNARVETIHEKPAYKNLVYSSRCIVPSTGFYEHHHVIINKKDTAIPFYIKPIDEDIFGMAGLNTSWVDKTTGEIINSFVIITTAANEYMAKVHNSGTNPHRMPLILEKEMEETWLNPGATKSEIDHILSYRIGADKLEGWPVKSIRKRDPDRIDGPEMLTREQIAEIDWA